MLNLKKKIKISVIIFSIISVGSDIYPQSKYIQSKKYLSKWDRVLDLGKEIKQGSIKERFETKQQILNILLKEEQNYPLVFVDHDASGYGDGSSWKNAFNEIQPAIDYLFNNEGEGWVWVAQGKYDPIKVFSGIMVFGGFSGSENLLSQRNFLLNMTIIRNKNGPGPTGPSGVILKHKTLIDGFTIKNCGFYNTPPNQLADNIAGGGIRSWSWFSIIRNNQIHDNKAGSGSGIAVWGRRDHQRLEEYTPIIERNIIHHNSATCGAVVIHNSEVFFINNIVCFNQCISLPNKSKGIEIKINPTVSDQPLIINSIIWGNTKRKYFSDLYNHVDFVDAYGDDAKAISLYNCIQHKGYGEGLVVDNPLFLDPNNYDYQLKENSPCINAGHPDAPLDPDSTRADIGIYILQDKSQYNTSPEITAIPDTSISEDSVLQILVDTYISDLTDSLSDLSFNIENNTHFVLDFNKIEETLNFIPQLNWFGEDSIILKVSDQWQVSDQDTFVVKVHPVDDPPGEFSLLYPVNDTVIGDTVDCLDFSWVPSIEVDGETVLYDFVVSTDFLFESGVLFRMEGIADSALTLNITDLDSTVFWGVVARDEHNATWCTSPFRLNFGITAFKDKSISIDNFVLYQNYPNPFNTETRVAFYLPQPSKVIMEIFDTSGRLVSVIADDFYSKGVHVNSWRISDSDDGEFSSGIYILQARLGSKVMHKKMMVVK